MPDLLRQPLEAIRRVQDAQLVRMLDLCARGHAYYRRHWDGVDVAAIRNVADLWRLPLTPKHHLIAEPESFRLHCPDLPLHERALWEVHHTTGTTDSPTPLYVTTHDFHAYLFQAQRVAEITGITDRDVLVNLFPMTPAPMGAFARVVANAYAVGAAVVGALTGPPHGAFGVHRPLDNAVRLVERHRATILWGITSFVRRVLLRAAELGADFSTVRMCAVTGEASSPGMREDMRRRLRALGSQSPVIFDRYGSTESGGLAQCREEGDWHNPAPEILYHEVVDPETGTPLPDGERGQLAITHLNRRGTVLVRYLVGDIVSLAHDPCPHCGRTGDRVLGPIVRTKDFMKVKGTLIDPMTLLGAVERTSGVDEFQVVLTRQDLQDPFSMDHVIVRIATQVSDRAAMAAAVIAEVYRAVGFRPRVEFAAAGDIYDPLRDAKVQRLVDRRVQPEVPSVSIAARPSQEVGT
jgi:phenylacetate-coenzyme A ligase PaaK-like adenylate-forming protein